MPVEPMLTIIRGILETAFNQGILSPIEDLLAADSTTHITAWGMGKNRVGVKQLIATFRSAFPDLHCTVEDEIWQGEIFAALWTMRGTHRGLFMGAPPTGRRIEVQGMIFARTAHGKILEDWILIDQYGMLQQLGIVPPPIDP
jgi:steroid delta-isomerase-like uncharacterized protein